MNEIQSPFCPLYFDQYYVYELDLVWYVVENYPLSESWLP